MYNKRQKDIIQYLKGKNHPVTAQQFADLFGVSSRTIRSDIESINQIGHSESIMSSNHGYQLSHDLDILVPETSIPQNREERQNYILQQLMLDGKKTTLTGLCESLYISTATIESDLKMIRTSLESFQLKIEKVGNQLKLMGEESQKRKLFRQLLNQETTDNFMNLGKIANLFTWIDYKQMKSAFDRICEREAMHLNGIAYHMILIHIGVALERIKWGNYNHQEKQTLVDEQSKEFSIAKSIAAEMEKLFQISIPLHEVKSFYLLLVGSKVWEHGEVVHQGINLEQFCNSTIQDVKNHFGVDLTFNEDFKNGLMIHLTSLLNRQVYEIDLRNVLLNDIKSNFPFVFELAIYFSQKIQESFGCSISENEIGFIAMHLGVGLESQKHIKRNRVVLVYPYDNAIKDRILSFLDEKFSSQIEVVKTMSWIDDATLEELDMDVLISTVTLQIQSPYILITPLCTDKDEQRILNHLNLYHHAKSKEENISSLYNFFSEDFFYTDFEGETPKDIIRFLCDRLYEKEIVTDRYYEYVLKRESISPTSFEQFIAIPHPIIFDSNESKGAVCILKRPILWGDYQVKIVILFAIRNEERRKLKNYYSLISNALIEEDKLKDILAAKTFDQFISVF